MNYKEIYINDEYKYVENSEITLDLLEENQCVNILYFIHRLQQLPRLLFKVYDDNVQFYNNDVIHFTVYCDHVPIIWDIIACEHIDFSKCKTNLMLRAYNKGYDLIGLEFKLTYPHFTTMINNVLDQDIMYTNNFHKHMNLNYLVLPLAMKWIIKYERYDMIDYYYEKDVLTTLCYSDYATIQYILKKHTIIIIDSHPIILATRIGYHYDDDVFKWMINTFPCDIIHCFQCVHNIHNQERIQYMRENFDLTYDGYEQEIIDLEIL